MAAAMLLRLAAAGAEPKLNETLLALPDNAWRKLDVKGTAKARMYSGACFGGGRLWYFGGAHRGYKGNDVELFDPRALAWTQATEAEWPAVGSADWKSMTSGGGTTRSLSTTGRPFTEHTYQQVCWQPGRRRFFIVLVSSGTWEFDPATRQWTHLTNRFEDKAADPRGSWAQNQVIYEPLLGAPVLIVGTGGDAARYQFDHECRAWKKLGPTPEKLKWNEPYMTYVPELGGHVASTSKNGWFLFQVARGMLRPLEAPDALSHCQSLAYDSANKVVIALARQKTGKYTQTVKPWALDVATMKWTELSPPRPWPEGQCTGNWAKLWYDPDHNVHLFVNDVRRDREELFDGGVTETWAYRYARPAPTTE
jgi:hypothetical protein